MKLLFSTRSYDYLKTSMLSLARNRGRFEAAPISWTPFPDGERGLSFAISLSDREAVLLGGTIDDAATLELFDIACGLVDEGCRSLTLVIPYFGYSTMERSTKPGEVVSAKARARLLSAIPKPPCGLRIGFLDLHSEGLPHYLEGDLRSDHLYAKPLILSAARKLGGRAVSLGCVDAGRAAWVASLARDLGVPAAFVLKRRRPGGKVEVVAGDDSVAGRTVVIYDDMIRTGASLIAAARAYRAGGAKEVFAVATHGVFTPGAVAAIEGSGVIAKIICTDSHPRAVASRSRFVSILSTAGLLGDYIAGRHYETH